MKFAFVMVATVTAVVFASCASQKAESQKAANQASTQPASTVKQPVLVELFTSEGCSSCPPADRALALLEKQQPVNTADAVTLEFHVDYWDGPGWKDPFSSALYSRRQEEYSSALKLGSNYTPQMVVNGKNEFVGSDLGKATQTIEKLAADPRAKTVAAIDGTSVKISVTGLGTHDTATVYLATVEDDLTSSVTGGENSGAKLAHASVVRQLSTVGPVATDADKFETETALPFQSAWKKENVRYVVFIQENASRKVLAVSRVTK